MAQIENFFALLSGDIEGTPYPQTVVPLGDLVLPSGKLDASDPFVSLGQSAQVDVEPGTYPVFVTIADVSEERDGSHPREAYVSVVLAPGEPVQVAQLDGNLGVGVDSGTVGFADADAVARCMPEGDWDTEIFDNGSSTSWFALMDSPDHFIAGCANIVMPLATAGENVVLSHSGWGDGWYQLLGAYDAAGKLLSIHIDLQVAGPEEDEDDEDE